MFLNTITSQDTVIVKTLSNGKYMQIYIYNYIHTYVYIHNYYWCFMGKEIILGWPKGSFGF